MLRRFAAALAFCALVVIAAGWVSRYAVGRLIDRQAAADLHAYADGASPFVWRFDSEADLAGGTVGLTAIEFGPRGMRARLTQNDADLSLNLRGRDIDAGLLKRLEIVLHADASASLSVFFSETLSPGALAFRSIDFPLAAGPQRLNITLDDSSWTGSPLTSSWGGEQGRAAVLRLHLLGRAGSGLHIESVALRTEAPAPAVACRGSEDIAETLRRCPGPLRWLAVPGFLTPEQTLHWRDQVLRAAPATIVSASAISLDELAPDSGHAGAAIAGMLALSLLLARRYGHSPRRRAALELSALFLPALWLLGSGWPADDTPWPVIAVFAVLLSLAMGLSRSSVPPGWRGQRTAWALTGMMTATGLLLLLVIHGLTASEPVIMTPTSSSGAFARSFEWDRVPRYILFAVVQQWILTGVLLERCRVLTRQPVLAALLSGALFAALHLPNFGLFCVTFIAGAVWAGVALRYRCLLPQVISHLVLGSVLMPLTPVWLLRSAEVGGRFLAM